MSHDAKLATSMAMPPQIEILIAEIPEDLQQKAKRRVCLAMDKYDIEKDIATDVKKHFDEECEGSWHCVVRNIFTGTAAVVVIEIIQQRIEQQKEGLRSAIAVREWNGTRVHQQFVQESSHLFQKSPSFQKRPAMFVPLGVLSCCLRFPPPSPSYPAPVGTEFWLLRDPRD